MKCSQPTAAQKLLREMVREFGSVISGGPAVIHHPVGRTAKHNKVEIGHWWIVPLTDEEHKALHNDGETFGYESRKDFEKAGFMKWVVSLADHVPLEYLPPENVEQAIMDYHR